MIAIILAAGYATRLYPLTINRPKALLPINDKPIIDYIVDEIETIDGVNEIVIVSNHKFADSFSHWHKDLKRSIKITVLDDGTTSEETRKGAIGDILFAIDEMKIDDEILVIAGDNFFTYSLKDYYRFYKKLDKDCVCVKEFDDRNMLKQFGVAVLDKDGRLIDIEEKPDKPKSNIAVYATYMYKKETVPMFKEYIDAGNKPDAPGYFLEWLYKRKDVYAYKFDGECYDIGTPETYKSVCEQFSIH
ncbi:glucose-1-phosphate thymidylyltransferase 1 [Clostridiales bacterium]|nr:glucose-1-phosphate thymidylyltransferase 1 [Clostridiales bacterium]